jgi:RHS repeat-associated protein
LAASTAYAYTIQAVDFHGNLSTATTVTATTAPAGELPLQRRVGITFNGSHWGGGGEQIDTLSGNLNFSLPLLTAQGRTGWTVPVSLVYNSQDWFQDTGVNWKLGNDVGFGFGWQMLIGSITYYQASGTTSKYFYTDSTGAQYQLGKNAGGVYTGASAPYVWLDTNVSPVKLHFRDGTVWVMGCTSGGAEPDAGTIYPTIIEDVSGNQVTIVYAPGAGLTSANTSARIVGINDGRAASGGASYSFNYNSDTPIPHLSSANDYIGTGVNYSFTYNHGVAVEPPFGTDPSFAGITTTQLASMTTPAANAWQFTYDNSGASELLQATFPWGGHLRWTYSTDPYNGSRDLRAVGARYLAADSAGATEWSYGISRDNASSASMHATMTLTDASGVGAKTWNFATSGTYYGLATEFVQSTSAGGTVLQDDLYTWSSGPAGNPYISTKASTTGQGTSNVATATSTQTLDQYGNVTQSVIYPYNNTTTPLATYNYTYLTSSTYTSNYIFNRLVTASVTPAGGSAITLVTNTYDALTNCTTWLSNIPPIQCSGFVTPSSGGPVYNVDPSPPIPVGQRGYLNYSVTPAKSTTLAVYTYGSPAMSWGSDGTVSSASADASTNFNAPVTITSQSYQTILAYNSWLGVTQSQGANGEQMSMSYDSFGRPWTATSPYCVSSCSTPTVSYTYGTSAPFTQTKTGPDGKTVTTLDGLGRAIRVDRGDTSSMHSSTATVYAPCACSPLAKIQKTSQPYVYGSSASAWTTYTYDGLGRPLTVQQPDGASTTTYSYSGNVTTVTDPAGKWKQFTTDVSGNLVTVTEPDPANPPSGTLTTTYTYDWMNHVTGVSMPRSGTTQNRSFVYDNVGRLTSATNPENGTVSYAYNSDNTLQKKTDARAQQTVYTYDSLKRLTMMQYYPLGTANPEDGCQRVTYSYDTNPYVASFSQNSYGRLTAILYGASSFCAQGPGAGMQTYFAEAYSYHPAGGVTAKQLLMARGYPGNLNPANLSGAFQANIEVDYTYDSAGRTASTSYPMQYGGSMSGAPVTLTYGYDSMGRPNALTDLSGATGVAWGWPSGTPVNWAQNVQYDYAGRMASMQYFAGFYYYTGLSAYIQTWTQESMSYNVNGQLGSVNWVSATWGGPLLGVQYNYSATQNNGQITQAVDTLSGETISYQYDSLKRLTSASSTPNFGSYPAAYTQTFQYDGFGNLTGKVLNGTTTPITVNAANNRLSSASYDANGNMTSGSGAAMVYDEANRISSAAAVSGGIEYYGYTADNKRFYKCTASGAEEITFYGVRGEKLGVYSLYNSMGYYISPISTNIWFAGKAILESGNPSMMDRLGTNRYSNARFYPYGDEISSTGNDREKFATYTRDSYTGFDYADQRYYASTYGRFNTADPYMASANGANNPGDPGTWNRYAYTAGDPINRRDPKGLLWSMTCGGAFGDGGGDADGPCTDGGCDTTILLNGVEVPNSDCYPELYGPTRPPIPLCQDQWGKVDQTLEGLGANILTVAEQKIRGLTASSIASLNADIQSDIRTEMYQIIGEGPGNASPPYYQGGHYNLDITTQQIDNDLGASAQLFIKDFTATRFLGTKDGVRQAAPNQPGYTLHSKLDGSQIDFHFDAFNPYSLIGVVGHPVYDVGYGSLFSPCLDPAWQH